MSRFYTGDRRAGKLSGRAWDNDCQTPGHGLALAPWLLDGRDTGRQKIVRRLGNAATPQIRNAKLVVEVWALVVPDDGRQPSHDTRTSELLRFFNISATRGNSGSGRQAALHNNCGLQRHECGCDSL